LSSSFDLSVTNCGEFSAEGQNKELHLEPRPSRLQAQFSWGWLRRWEAVWQPFSPREKNWSL